MSSQQGDWVGQGRTYSFGQADGTYQVSGTITGGVQVSFTSTNGSEWWYLDFAPAAGGQLVPGTYTNVARAGFQQSGQAGLDVFGDGRGSNTVTGQFTVIQALYDANGTILAFAADFEQHSEGDPAAHRPGQFQVVARQG